MEATMPQMNFEDLTAAQKDAYMAENITPGGFKVWDVSRAWKLLVVFRDVALGQDPPDIERAMRYTWAIEDTARMLQALGMPLPPGSAGESEADREMIVQEAAHRLRAEQAEAAEPLDLSDPFEPPVRRSTYAWPDEEAVSSEAYVSPVPEGWKPAEIPQKEQVVSSDQGDGDDDILDLSHWGE